ncbi:hypothetical protein JL108_17850 [Aeromicrobium sp. YIM 150415]|uniref:hypothetical protein n=1 Tax=Aeromicrobium sp. YIM 150415 TaxID=2803912 RepID=UPI001964DC9E|nr:hypothetical protein [Aeromicrobium sp. YIM 150415]MBM9465317.1 hypothetical protein [Aeromicrobium sp. YIM 150415]
MAADPSWIVLARQALPGQRIELGMRERDPGAWTPLRSLADSRAWPSIARDYADGISARSAVVGASCALQGLASRVMGPVLVGWALGHPVPRLADVEVEVLVRAGRTTGVRYSVTRTTPLHADELVTSLATVIHPLVEAIRETFALTERVLWGNVGASCAGALGAAHRIASDAEVVRQHGERLLAGPWLVSLAVEPRTCDGAWTYRRDTCCLIHLGDGHRFCPGCSRVDPADDRVRWRERLEELAR